MVANIYFEADVPARKRNLFNHISIEFVDELHLKFRSIKQMEL